MIINKILIENYLCYYGVNEFNLANGLNIILGDNGEGKTKFYEAIDWLFNGDSKNLDLLVSAKALDEVSFNDQFRVRVSMTIEQYGEKKIISKSFIVQKKGDEQCLISNFSIEGIEENNKGERISIDGNLLLDRVFPPEIRRYSMFKGEKELNIFNNKEALGHLINSFSSAKYYQKYLEKGTFLKNKAERAVDDATRLNRRKEQEYKSLESEIKELQRKRENLTVYKNSNEEQINKVEENIEEAEKYVTNAEALGVINGRIKKIEENILSIENKIDENYTTLLFDENWLLVNFEKTHHVFSKKIAQLSNDKRKEQSEFDKQIGISEGKKQITNELLNNLVPLQLGVPSKAHMEEMIQDEFCKVCNRPAEKGSEPYEFMQKRLDAYLKSQSPVKPEEAQKEVLFKNNYLNRLFNMTVSHEDSLAKLRNVREEIKDLLEFNVARKSDIEVLKVQLEKELYDREKIIGASSIGSEKLTSVLKNYNVWQRDLKDLNNELINYNQTLADIENELEKVKEKKDKIDIESANTFLIKTREVLRDIEIIFKDTKEKKYDEFIKLLENKSNNIMQEINVDDFTGTIIINKRNIGNKSEISIDLFQNDRKFHNPNESLETSKNMSVLFAISELAADIREENFPMIFDAPTSSFGETKTKDFLNLVFETGKQRIVLFYDFVGKNGDSNLFIKPEFNEVKRHKTFWIKRQRPFDKNILSTINTEVIPL